MRIIAGTLRGRSITLPPDAKLRPTTELVRGAAFSALQSLVDLDSAIILDLFAGSGAFGFEGLSRGAQFAFFVERDRRLVQALRNTAVSFDLTSRVEVIATPVERLLDFSQVAEVAEAGVPCLQKSNIIFADPPYEYALSDQFVQSLLRGGVSPGALILLEGARDTNRSQHIYCSERKSIASFFKLKRYGETALSFYRVTSGEGR